MSKSPYEKYASVYDAYHSSDFHKKYFSFTNKIFSKLKFRPKSILEVACGTGKLMSLFSNRNIIVDGMDDSSSMLNIAKKKGLNVFKGNMINFNLSRKYGAVFCVYDSLNYLGSKSEIKSCFKSISKHLNSEGLFIFDMNSDYKINTIFSVPKTEYKKIGNIEVMTSTSHKKDTWIVEKILFEKINGLYKRFYEKHVEHAYSLRFVLSALNNAGFKVVAKYSDFDFSPIKEDSKRWFFVCEKI